MVVIIKKIGELWKAVIYNKKNNKTTVSEINASSFEEANKKSINFLKEQK